jgi:hypothetical protein
VPTTAGGSSPGTDNAKTIESFLQDARNAVGIGSPGAASPGVSPLLGSRAQSPSSPGPRGARSRSVSPGRAERTPNRAASSTTLRWNAPLPGDTLAATQTRSPASPGTPAVFSAGYLGADAFVGGFGAFGSYANGVSTPSRALERATHARFDVSLDPALRFGVKNIAGNPAVATSILPTYGGAGGGGFSGAAFGDVFSRERAASVTAFREAALMRDQIRVEGTRGVGVDDRAAKEEIKRLESVVLELASEVRAFTSGARRDDKNRRDETTERETTERENENVPPGARYDPLAGSPRFPPSPPVGDWSRPGSLGAAVPVETRFSKSRLSTGTVDPRTPSSARRRETRVARSSSPRRANRRFGVLVRFRAPVRGPAARLTTPTTTRREAWRRTRICGARGRTSRGDTCGRRGGTSKPRATNGACGRTRGRRRRSFGGKEEGLCSAAARWAAA